MSSSHLFWKLLADVGKPLNCSPRGFCTNFLIFFFLPPSQFPTTGVCFEPARLTCGLPRPSPLPGFYKQLGRVKTTEPHHRSCPARSAGARTVIENLLPEDSFQLPFLRPREPQSQPSGEVLAFPAAACNLQLDLGLKKIFFFIAFGKILGSKQNFFAGWKVNFESRLVLKWEKLNKTLLYPNSTPRLH